MSWRLQFFTPPKASGPAYVKDGLVVWLDGMWNAGVGIHDPAATTWRNLVDGAPFALSGRYAVNADNVYFNKESGARSGIADGSISLPSGERTIEACISKSESAKPSVSNSEWLTSPNTVPTAYFVDGMMSAYSPSYDALRKSRSFSGRAGTASWRFTAAGVETYDGGTYAQAASGTAYPLNAYSGPMTVANRPGNDRPFIGKLHCLRIYSRALTAEEIAQNYAVDKERFQL